MNFKKIVTNLVSAALGLLAWLSSFIGSMEFFESKNYFGLDDEIFLAFTILFSIMVGGFSFSGFKDFIEGLQNKDKKK